MEYKIPLLLTPQAEGGYTVTSPMLPELVTEGDSVSEALENVQDAFAAVLELYERWDVHCQKTHRFLRQRVPCGWKRWYLLREVSRIYHI